MIVTEVSEVSEVPDAYEPMYGIGATLIAEQLVARYQHRHMYVVGVGWYSWDGTRWADDNGTGTDSIHHRIHVVARELTAESASATSADERRAMQKAANRVLDRAGEAAAIAEGVLRYHPEIAVTANQLDADPYLLNVANGTLDLHTLELRDPDPRDRITKVTRAAWRPDIPAPSWDGFLTSALDDTDLIDALARCVGGLGLPGRVEGVHIFPVFYGPGGSGKSTCTESIRYALGDYAITGSDDLIVGNGSHPTAAMDLLGARLVIVGETEDGGRINAALVKRLTGGDQIRARRMYRDFIEFEPSHLLMLHTNHLPAVTNGGDSGLWRRLYVVPFTRPPQNPDSNLGTRLREEADGILTWLVRGLVDFRQRGGIEWPQAVTEATGRYRQDADNLGAFLDETTETCPPQVGCIPSGEAYARWCEWVKVNGDGRIKAGRRQDFRRALEQRGEVIDDMRTGGSRSVIRGRRWIQDDPT